MKTGQITCSACSHVFAVPARARAAICPRCGQALPVFAGSIEPAEVPAPKKPPQTDEILEEPTTGSGAQLARIRLKKRAKPPPVPPPVPPPPPPAGTFSTIPGAPPAHPDLPVAPRPPAPDHPFEDTGAAHLIPIETEEHLEPVDELTVEDDEDEQETEAYDPLDMHGDTRQTDSPPWMDPAMEVTGPDLPRRVPGPPIDMSYFERGEQPRPEPVVPEAANLQEPELSTGAGTHPFGPAEVPTLADADGEDPLAEPPTDGGELPPLPAGPGQVHSYMDLSSSQRMAVLDQAITEAIDTETTEAYAPKPPGLSADPETFPTVPSGVPPRRVPSMPPPPKAPLVPPPPLAPLVPPAPQVPPASRAPLVPPPPRAPLVPPPPQAPLVPPAPQAPLREVPSMPAPQAPLREVPSMPPPQAPLREVPSMPPAPQAPLKGIPSFPPPPARPSADAPVSLTDSGIMVVVPDMPVEEVGAGEEPPPGARPAPVPKPVLIDELAPISKSEQRSAAGHGSALRDQKPTGLSTMTIAVIAGIGGAVLLVVAILLLVKYLG